MIEVLIFGFTLGAILGSFIKAIADRSLTKVSFWGRSYCVSCKKQLVWYDLFPIFSFIFLKGKCRFCKKKIPFDNFLVEILMGVLIAYLFQQSIPSNYLQLEPIPLSLIATDLVFKTLAVCILLIALITDLKEGIIPDRVTYPAILIAFIYLILITIYKIALIYLSLINSLIGKYLLPPYSDYFLRHVLDVTSPFYMGVFSAFILSLFFGGLIVITKGKGMGGGDFKLAIFIGLVLGFPNFIVALVLAFLTGSIVGVALLLIGKKHFGQTIPFGPFLTLGSISAIFWGDKILNWYLNFKFV